MTKSKTFVPQKHQTDVVDYIMSTPHKGLLVYHTIGSGKTCTAIMFADEMLKRFPKLTVRVFLPATLRENFIEEYCKTCGKSQTLLKEKYIFYSYNYSGIINLLPLTLDNSIIIVDEAHRLINGKRNGTKTAVEIYELIYKAKNSKILLLTATPLNKIIDIPLYSYLLKESYVAEKVAEDPSEFQGITFMKNIKKIDMKNYFEYVPIDAQPILDMLNGIVSYYKAPQDKHYPKRIDMPPQKVEMSDLQLTAWTQVSIWESSRFKPDERLRMKRPELYTFLLGLWQIAKKKLLSRSTSNFQYPKVIELNGTLYGFNIPLDMANFPVNKLNKLLQDKEAVKAMIDIIEASQATSHTSEKSITQDLLLPTLPDATVNNGGWVSDEVFEPYKLSRIYSPKMYMIAMNIAKNLDGKHVIYSALKTRGGVNIMRAILDLCGLKTLVYSGDIQTDKQRASILEKFNSSRTNLRGERYQVMLITEAGSEGLTFKNVKYFHIMESDIKESKIQQVIGRAIRYDSHSDLPERERIVKVYRYFSVTGFQDNPGTDTVLYEIAHKKQENLNTFLQFLIDSSVT